MADTGWKFPGTMVGDRFLVGSDVDWTNPDNAKVDDSSDATCTLTGSQTTRGLGATNFDFSVIPAGATIDGIEVRIGDYSVDTVANTPIIIRVKLIRADNSDGTDEQSSVINDPIVADFTDAAGGSVDLWEENFSQVDITDVDFGFWIAFSNPSGTTEFQVDFMQMRVFYHEGLPTTIVSTTGLDGHHPPFLSSGGNFYSFVRADDDELDAYKASDPSDSWSIQGTGPVHAGTLLGYSCVQDGDVIHIVAWSSAAYEYYTFNMATDAWVTDQAIEASINTAFPFASIAVRSDGDVIVVYGGITDSNMGNQKERVDVNIRTGGTWGGPFSLDAGGDVHYGNPNCVLGTNDGTHMLFQRQTDTTQDPPLVWSDIQVRTLNSSDILSTVDTDTVDTGARMKGMKHPVFYIDGSEQRIVWPGSWGIALGRSLVIITATEDGSDNIVIETADQSASGVPIFPTIVELSGDLHILFSGGGLAGGDFDLYYTTSTDDGVTWTAAAEEIDAITVNFISANIFVRGADTVMAYVYHDTGVQKYGEKVLISGAAPDFLSYFLKRTNILLRM